MTNKEFDRFWDKVEIDINDCWNWKAHRNSKGYGVFGLRGNVYLAHRVSYEHSKGKIKHTIDHLCRNRACVNPDHLEDVTQSENTYRGNNPAAINKRKTHCHKGHEFTPNNTYTNKKDGRRTCLACSRDYQMAYREKRKKNL